MDERERAIRQRLKSDFLHYASKCLRIRTKNGAIEPLELNRVQRHIHAKLEGQREATGRVRALVLKARQQGASTYIGGRYYWRSTHSRGVRTFILTHEDAATQNLFEMVTRYHEHCPDLVKPETGASNAKELFFSKLDSGYKVGTAGTKGVGRSSTVQLFHGSEVAFWPHADAHAAGVLQAVPDEPGTEVILESTANGLGNFFHKKWREAEREIGDYIAIFVPWFWQEEYAKPTPSGFHLSDEEEDYRLTYGLTFEQMAWRRDKISELGDPLLFRQEYPATADEAFVTTGHDSFIKPEPVVRARKNKVEGIGPLVIGADPADYGDDGFAVAWRRGRKVERVEVKYKLGAVQGANWLKHIIDEDRPDRVFVDVGNTGSAIVDMLKSWGEPYLTVVKPINFGGEPQEPVSLLPSGEKRPGPKNRRAEMWSRMREWLDDPAGVSIPDDDDLQADICAPSYSYDANQRLLLERKEHMKARGVHSPDKGDAVALTYAEPVAPAKPKVQVIRSRPRSLGVGGGSWMG